MKIKSFFLGICLLILAGCQSEKTLTVAANPIPHGEILEAAKPLLEKGGIHLKIVEVDDYNLPNRLLAEGQVDANFFQHQLFLDEQNRRFGYQFKSLVAVHIEPLGIYSEKHKSLEALQNGATIAIPSDPTNEARALILLKDLGLIQFEQGEGHKLVMIYDITENPKQIKIEEIDAAFLPRTLKDVDAAIIPANFALQAQLNPNQDALALEPKDSPYANLVAIKQQDEGRLELQLLKEALLSDEVRDFMEKKYQGVITPAIP
jgi:D-methionine transport system substrate-binding protein